MTKPHNIKYNVSNLTILRGKDVSFMENKANWHGSAPNDEQFEQAMKDLEKVGEALCQK